MTVAASVIVPTYRDWDSLAGCLTALAKQDLNTDEFEIIVANNNPESAIPASLPLAPNMHVIWERKAGSYAARNAAIKKARGRYLFFTDADCRPAPTWLSRGIRLFEEDEGRRRIAGAIAVAPRSGRWNGWSVFDRTFRLRQDRYARRGAAVTANLAVERSLFDEVGLFNEASFSGQDMEWNRRATAAGMPLTFDLDMRVDHFARDSFSDCAGKVRRIAGARYTAKSHRPLGKRMPRLKYLLPSITDLAEIWRHPEPAPLRAKISAMWCHYALGWVYNAEIVRLGFLGGTPRRS